MLKIKIDSIKKKIKFHERHSNNYIGYKVLAADYLELAKLIECANKKKAAKLNTDPDMEPGVLEPGMPEPGIELGADELNVDELKEKALECYDNAFKCSDNECSDVLISRALLLMNMKRYQQAIRDIIIYTDIDKTLDELNILQQYVINNNLKDIFKAIDGIDRVYIDSLLPADSNKLLILRQKINSEI